MKRLRDPLFRRDLLKLGCLTGAILGVSAIFVMAPTFSTPTLLSFVGAILLSPFVASLERRGYSRAFSISALFIGIGMILVGIGIWGIRVGLSEWGSFREHVPLYFEASIARMNMLETQMKASHPFLGSMHPTQSLLTWGSRTGEWFVDHGPTVMSHFLSWLFIVPLLTFVFLNEGPVFRRQFYHLVPNRYFESFFLITTDIFHGISDYLRAKLLEAFLVGLIATMGLSAVGAPYALVLGFLIGITNIIPYLGPFFGAIPAVIISSLDGGDPHLVYSVAAVLVVTNIIDMTLIFPLIVAKLVKLHPLVLVIAVAIGQRYYGFVGMLLSIPVATALKVVLQEIYYAVYERRPSEMSFSTNQGSETSGFEENPVLKPKPPRLHKRS